MTKKIDKILTLLDNELQRPGDDAYPTEAGALVDEQCWRCMARTSADTTTGLCDPCAEQLRSEEALPERGDMTVELMEFMQRQAVPPEIIANLFAGIRATAATIADDLRGAVGRIGESMAAAAERVVSERMREYTLAHRAGACLVNCPFCAIGDAGPEGALITFAIDINDDGTAEVVGPPAAAAIAILGRPDDLDDAINASRGQRCLSPSGLEYFQLCGCDECNEARMEAHEHPAGCTVPACFRCGRADGTIPTREPPGEDWRDCDCFVCDSYRAFVRLEHDRIGCGGCEICVGL